MTEGYQYKYLFRKRLKSALSQPCPIFYSANISVQRLPDLPLLVGNRMWVHMHYKCISAHDLHKQRLIEEVGSLEQQCEKL